MRHLFCYFLFWVFELFVVVFLLLLLLEELDVELLFFDELLLVLPEVVVFFDVFEVLELLTGVLVLFCLVVLLLFDVLLLLLVCFDVLLLLFAGFDALLLLVFVAGFVFDLFELELFLFDELGFDEVFVFEPDVLGFLAGLLGFVFELEGLLPDDGFVFVAGFEPVLLLGFEFDEPLEVVLDDDGFGLSALDELLLAASPSCGTCLTMATEEIFPSGVMRAVILYRSWVALPFFTISIIPPISTLYS